MLKHIIANIDICEKAYEYAKNISVLDSIMSLTDG